MSGYQAQPDPTTKNRWSVMHRGPGQEPYVITGFGSEGEALTATDALNARYYPSPENPDGTLHGIRRIVGRLFATSERAGDVRERHLQLVERSILQELIDALKVGDEQLNELDRAALHASLALEDPDAPSYMTDDELLQVLMFCKHICLVGERFTDQSLPTPLVLAARKKLCAMVQALRNGADTAE